MDRPTGTHWPRWPFWLPPPRGYGWPPPCWCWVITTPSNWPSGTAPSTGSARAEWCSGSGWVRSRPSSTCWAFRSPIAGSARTTHCVPFARRCRPTGRCIRAPTTPTVRWSSIPVPSRVASPIWVGGRTKRSLRRAIEFGQGWMPFGLSGLKSRRCSRRCRCRPTSRWCWAALRWIPPTTPVARPHDFAP